MPPTANAFRAAVASCVDADLDDYSPSSKRRTPRGAAVAGAGTGGAAFSSSSVSSPAAAEPMRVSFRGMFEAFASTLETSPSRGGGRIAGVGIGGDATEWGESVGREGVALLLYSLLQVCAPFGGGFLYDRMCYQEGTHNAVAVRGVGSGTVARVQACVSTSY